MSADQSTHTASSIELKALVEIGLPASFLIEGNEAGCNLKAFI